MTTSFNTGTTVDGGGLAPSVAVTIPAGVHAGDVVFVVFSCSNTTGAETIQVSSTGTTPTLLGSSQNSFSAPFSGTALHGALFYFIAAASDAGKFMTASLVSADTAAWVVALGAWTGASASAPVDVSGVTAVVPANSATLTCPSETTGVANDWDLQIIAMLLQGSAFTGGTGFTQRESVVDGPVGGGAAIYDSNGSVGPAGTTIGGASFANAGNNSWWIGWTVGLAAPGGGGTVSPMIAREVMTDITQTATYQVVYEDELLWE